MTVSGPKGWLGQALTKGREIHNRRTQSALERVFLPAKAW